MSRGEEEEEEEKGGRNGEVERWEREKKRGDGEGRKNRRGEGGGVYGRESLEEGRH